MSSIFDVALFLAAVSLLGWAVAEVVGLKLGGASILSLGTKAGGSFLGRTETADEVTKAREQHALMRKMRHAIHVRRLSKPTASQKHDRLVARLQGSRISNDRPAPAGAVRNTGPVWPEAYWKAPKLQDGAYFNFEIRPLKELP